MSCYNNDIINTVHWDLSPGWAAARLKLEPGLVAGHSTARCEPGHVAHECL